MFVSKNTFERDQKDQYTLINELVEKIKKLEFEIENNKNNLRSDLQFITTRIDKIPITSTIEFKSRLEDLELWRGKMHNLAVEKTPAGRDKLNKTGKKIFGGF